MLLIDGFHIELKLKDAAGFNVFQGERILGDFSASPGKVFLLHIELLRECIGQHTLLGFLSGGLAFVSQLLFFFIGQLPLDLCYPLLESIM